MNSASEELSKASRKNKGRSYPASELESVRPSKGRSAHIGRLNILALLAAFAVFVAAGPRPVVAASRADTAPKAPDFSIMANDGQTYTPDYLKGNVVLLFFWATWCPYCRAAMPHMNDLASEYANASFTIIGICGGKDSDAWRNYIEEHHMDGRSTWTAI
ncbi:MAG TPA: TlpA disulfide reductase family protein [Terriglobia bacterium]|nr:TlpA disulfide reductase family protein [Terriglobia bacterium]